MDKLLELNKISKNLDVLYVEDEILLQKKTEKMFKNIFAKVVTADDGVDAIEKYEEYYNKNHKYFDIVITDVKMPNCDGLELCKILYEINKSQSIVVTSAHNESDYLIEFINIGIKKFIKKPFTLESIISVFADVCEEIDETKDSMIIELINNYKFDLNANILTQNGDQLKLSYNELTILKLLIENQNKIFSNDDLYMELVNENFDKEFSTDSVKSAIKRLRKKLPDGFIKNIYAQGYQLDLTMITHNI